MREARTAQQSIFQGHTDHEIAWELGRMSDWLDEHPELLDWVGQDLLSQGGTKCGRRGLTVDSVLRCAILKHYRQVDYRTLSFYLRDSVSFIEFARLQPGQRPSKTTLQALISAIQPETWERLRAELLHSAASAGVEDGQVIRIDATATNTAILAPTDSGLLYDAVRVMVRLLKSARQRSRQVQFSNHQRLAKRRRHAIQHARRNDRRRPLYEDLLAVTTKTLRALDRAYKVLEKQKGTDAWRHEADHYRPLICQIIEQTRRRVIDGESVPAQEKVVSLFEPHTDIIIKDRRDVQYGHKLTISAGASGLVTDVVVESGNPADSSCLLPSIERHAVQYGQPPQQLAADGGYASQNNLVQAKQMGVEAVAFHKRQGLSVSAMTGDQWLYRKLRHFRAGIESIISCLKRMFGLSRCNWKGLERFKAYVQGAVFTYNLTVLTQRLAASG
jgi:IS5 family transposase